MRKACLVYLLGVFAAGCTATVPEPPANVLKTEPTAGLPLNEPLLIDDGSCPPGTIKQLIYKGPMQSLVRQCVRRPVV